MFVWWEKFLIGACMVAAALVASTVVGPTVPVVVFVLGGALLALVGFGEYVVRLRRRWHK